MANFKWDETLFRKAEAEFLRGRGLIGGALKHLPGTDQTQFALDAMMAEALTTSEIEGEVLDRACAGPSTRRSRKRRYSPGTAS